MVRQHSNRRIAMTLIREGVFIKQGQTISDPFDCTDMDLIYIIFPITWNPLEFAVNFQFLLSLEGKDGAYRYVYENVQSSNPGILQLRFLVLATAFNGANSIWYNSYKYEFDGHVRLQLGTAVQQEDRAFTCFLRKKIPSR
jgi:hypothetical protein